MSLQNVLSSAYDTLFGAPSPEQERLQQETDKKRDLIVGLQELQSFVDSQAGKVHQAVIKAQATLPQPAVKAQLPQEFDLIDSEDLLKKIASLSAITEMARQGRLLTGMESDLKKLNESSGQSLAAARFLEEQTNELKQLNATLEEILRLREENSKLTYQIAEHLQNKAKTS